nr:hypothetical protein [Mycoplasmopsis bovis]
MNKCFAARKIAIISYFSINELYNAWEQRINMPKIYSFHIELKIVTTMNLVSYSVTNKDGFVNQNEYFDDGGKAVFADKKNSYNCFQKYFCI